MKNFENSGSPFMYPIEYRWMSALTPVTNMHMVMDSGSSRMPTLTWSPPTVIQLK